MTKHEDHVNGFSQYSWNKLDETDRLNFSKITKLSYPRVRVIL